MIKKTKNNRSNIKRFFALYKHSFIVVFIFLSLLLTILLFSRQVLSQENKIMYPLDDTSSIAKNISIQNSYFNEVNENLLYALARSELKNNNQQFLVDENIVDYKGYFKQLQFQTYTIKKNDTFNKISKKFNINIDTLISFNKIESTNLLKINNQLIIPNINGILHVVKKKETLKNIVKKYSKYKVKFGDVALLNNIVSNKITPGERLFIPGAKLLKDNLVKKLEHLFVIPAKGLVTSLVGMRKNVFRRSRKNIYEFHPGIDIKAHYGSPVRAARSGVVRFSGRLGSYGKVIFIDHSNGLQTRYGHLSKIIVKQGAKIKKRQLIGKVGSTGRSTGPHLHFEVRKYGKVVNITRKLKGLKLKHGGYWKWN